METVEKDKIVMPIEFEFEQELTEGKGVNPPIMHG